MPSSYTSLLRFELPVQGELSGTWGNVVNTAITTPVSEAIAGTTSISVGATDYTLTNGDGASANEARKMFITATGSPGAARNVICPATSKLYVFRNDTSGGFAMTLKTSAGSGVAVPAGQSRLLYCNGTNVVEAVNGFGSLTLGTALAATSGGTGQASYAVGDIIYASSTTALSKLTVGATNAVLTVAAGIPSWVATLPVASGGTGAATLTANNVLLGNGTSAVQTVAPGTAGNLLTSNGTTWTSAAAPSSYAGPNSQTFDANGTFTVPAGITSVYVAVIAGGGGGSGGCPLGVAGNAGGAGAAAFARVSGLTPSSTVSVTVGSGGAGSAGVNGTPAVGSTGNTSSFGSHVSCTGGAGGPNGAAGGTGAVGTITTGGSATLLARRGPSLGLTSTGNVGNAGAALGCGYTAGGGGGAGSGGGGGGGNTNTTAAGGLAGVTNGVGASGSNGATTSGGAGGAGGAGLQGGAANGGAGGAGASVFGGGGGGGGGVVIVFW